MKVAVINAQTPFQAGRLEWLADRLCEALAEHGHSTELVRIPFHDTPAEIIVDHMLAARLVRLDNVDRAIALGFPAYFLAHDDKVVWLLRQFRHAYDLWGTPFQQLPSTDLGASVRSAVLAADGTYLGEARRIHARSAVASRRLHDYVGLGSEVLYPPLRDPAAYRCDEYGDYVLTLGRIGAHTRHQVAVAAIGLAHSAARLVIAGPPDDPADLSALADLARELGVERRIEFIAKTIGEDEKVRLLAGARGVLSLPWIGDSGAHVTLEAFASHKPVLAFADGGGAPELVDDRVSGRAIASIDELAEAIDELAEDPAVAERYGDAAFGRFRGLGVSWETVVEELTR